MDSGELRETESELVVPQEIAEKLCDLYGKDVVVPHEVDEAVMAMARRRLAPRRGLHPIFRWRWAWATGVAAAILLVVCLVRSPERPRERPASRSFLTATKDFDGSGRVDILDAFGLARYIEFVPKPEAKWDMNGDGVVNRADVDRIALAAVSLKRGT